MSGNRPSRRRIVGALAVLAALSACANAPSPRLFILTPRPADPVGKLAAIVKVKRVTIAQYLDRPQLVRYTNANELTVSEFNRWSGQLADIVTSALVQNLASLLPDCKVYADSSALTLPPADVVLEIDVSRFEPDPQGTVALAAQWVVHGKGRSDAIHLAKIDAPAKPNDPSAQVAAMSDALAQFASQIASGLIAAS